MSLTSAYQLDSAKENEGVKILMPPNEDGSIPTFIIARTGRSNKRYSKALERNMRPVQAQMRTKTLSNEKADELLMASFVEGALLNWQNVLLSDVTGSNNDKGFAEFSQENAKKLLSRLPELYVDLQERANDITLFREGETEEATKN